MNMIAKLVITLFILYILGYGFVVLKNVWTKDLDVKKTLPNPFGFVHFKKEVGPQTQLTLKERGQNLSKEILEFLADRERSEPRSPHPETWNLDTELMRRHSRETMNQYSIKFASHVIAIRNELTSVNLKDEDLNRFYEHPTNPIGIRIVGERIGALSEKL